MGRARRKALKWLTRDQTLEGEILEPATPLWGAIAKGITQEFGLQPIFTALRSWAEPEWREVAPGISCKPLASDEERAREHARATRAGCRLSAAHARGRCCICSPASCGSTSASSFPATTAASSRALRTRALSSETGCTCVLVTSPRDILR
jgi:hypothetical protein